MAAAINEIIAQLEKQRDAIDRALSALRELEGKAAAPAVKASAKAAPADKTTGKPAKKTRKGGMTPEGKERLVAALKARWAAKKAAAEALAAAPPKRGRPKKTA